MLPESIVDGAHQEFPLKTNNIDRNSVSITDFFACDADYMWQERDLRVFAARCAGVRSKA